MALDSARSAAAAGGGSRRPKAESRRPRPARPGGGRQGGLRFVGHGWMSSKGNSEANGINKAVSRVVIVNPVLCDPKPNFVTTMPIKGRALTPFPGHSPWKGRAELHSLIVGRLHPPYEVPGAAGSRDQYGCKSNRPTSSFNSAANCRMPSAAFAGQSTDNADDFHSSRSIMGRPPKVVCTMAIQAEAVGQVGPPATATWNINTRSMHPSAGRCHHQSIDHDPVRRSTATVAGGWPRRSRPIALVSAEATELSTSSIAAYKSGSCSSINVQPITLLRSCPPPAAPVHPPGPIARLRTLITRNAPPACLQRFVRRWSPCARVNPTGAARSRQDAMSF